jgi:pyruvate ferredoxin oxidoreductase gamma subunit
LEAIGGQGANSAGKIIAEAAVLGMKYSGNHFSSFGSEKRGTPVRSYVRYSPRQKIIRSASAIEKPDLLVIFHENLISTHPEILDGISNLTDVVVNSKLPPNEITFFKNKNIHRVATLDATELASKNKCGLNAVMLGAISPFLYEIPDEIIQSTLDSFFLKSAAEIQKNNLSGFAHGKSHVQIRKFSETQAQLTAHDSETPDWGWANAPIGGMIITPGNSILKDHSGSRKGFVPLLSREICFNCGFCDMICPDFCFVWTLEKTDQTTKSVLTGIDYQYCKGCQKCIEICPVSALTLIEENELPITEKNIKAFKNSNGASNEE